MSEEKRKFWTSLSGLITVIAAILSAITGLYSAIWGKPQTSLIIKNDYSKNQYQTHQAFNLRATINDPDGYTNVRSMNTASSKVVTTVHDGEQFYTYKQNGNWWRIKTGNGIIGYMHNSRIKILEEK